MPRPLRPALVVAIFAVVGGAVLVYGGALAFKAVMARGNVVMDAVCVAWAVLSFWAYINLVADEIEDMVRGKRI